MRLLRKEVVFLCITFVVAVAFRLIPRLGFDPYLLTFDADIWYRLCLVQFTLDNGHLPVWDIRYEAYGQVPFWYTPGAVLIYAALSKLTQLDLPVVASRVMPFVESVGFIPFYFLARYLYGIRAAVVATVILVLTPSFLFWSSIGTPQGFSMFCIPLAILLWITFVQQKYVFGRKGMHFLLLSILLTVNFYTHLTYFNTVIILLLVHLSLVSEKVGRMKQYFWLLGAILVSQLLTIGWWLPNNLYWWWTTGLSTSTASPDRILFLKHYGTISAILGHIAFFGLIVMIFGRKHQKTMFFLLPVYWAIYPILESHMEGILFMFRRDDLIMNNMVRPIEGFRFYSFLAQPLALCVALLMEKILSLNWAMIRNHSQRLVTGFVILVTLVMSWDLIYKFNLPLRYQEHMVSLEDIEAARWYRQTATGDDRIIADYYTAQMFSGICAGRVLLGSMFPLKGAGLPYITDSWQVLEDIHTLYKTEDVQKVQEILNRYGITYVFYSKELLRKIEFVLNGYGDVDGFNAGGYTELHAVDHSQTILNPSFFDVVYASENVKILAFKP